MAERATLRIADITVGLISEDPHMRLEVEGALERFLVEETQPDLTVRASWADLPQTTPGEKVFDSGGLWQLYRENGSYHFRFVSPAISTRPYKVASFTKDFTVGQVRLQRGLFSSDAAVYPLEYPLDELLIVNWLARGRGVELHSSAVVDSAGNGHLFVGHSGAGKTTMARLWQTRDGARILSDDRTIVRKVDGRFWMYGTPWQGAPEFTRPDRAPLARVHFLKHGTANELLPQTATEAVGRLFAGSFLPFYSRDALERTLGFLEELVGAVPCQELRFTPDDKVVAFIEGLNAER
jgi:hypothetical protein